VGPSAQWRRTLKAAVPLDAGVRSKALGKRKAAEKEDSDSDGEPDDDEQPQDE